MSFAKVAAERGALEAYLLLRCVHEALSHHVLDFFLVRNHDLVRRLLQVFSVLLDTRAAVNILRAKHGQTEASGMADDQPSKLSALLLFHGSVGSACCSY
eukprot:scaffold1446_cov391-Prasinococcus_capsulatus_cf.AAC.10